MNPEIKKINETTWIIDEGGVRFFLLAGSEKAILIDNGMQVKNAKEIAESLTDLPIVQIYTHADPDHTGSSAEFNLFYMHPSETVNYFNAHKGNGTMIPVWEGDVIDLGGRPLEIIALPGHTPGSIGILDVNARVLISGDPIQDGGIFMFGPLREMRAYIGSLKRLEKMTSRFDNIWPSHGTLPVKPELIKSLYEGAEKVLAGEVKGEEAEFFGNKFIRYNIGVASLLYDGK